MLFRHFTKFHARAKIWSALAINGLNFGSRAVLIQHILPQILSTIIEDSSLLRCALPPYASLNNEDFKQINRRL